MTRLLLSFLGAALLFLAACSTANDVLNRKESAYVQNNDVSAKDSTHIVNGRIYRGMPVQSAIAALGRPMSTDTSNWNGDTKLKLTYQARSTSTRGYMKRAQVHAVNDSVTQWEDLNKIPRFDAYYEIGN